MMNSLKNKIFSKMDVMSAKLQATIEPLQHLVESHKETVKDLELCANDHSSQISELETTVGTLIAQMTCLEAKCEELKGRSCMNNIQLTGGCPEK